MYHRCAATRAKLGVKQGKTHHITVEEHTRDKYRKLHIRLPQPKCLLDTRPAPHTLVFPSSAILAKSKIQVTFALLFLLWFFNVLPTSSLNPSGQNPTPRKQSLYDKAERHALIRWDPVNSRHVTLLRSLIVKVEG